MALYLTFMSGPRDGETLSFADDAVPAEIVFGRVAACAISLPDDPEVSRRHARLAREGESWLLEDLNSANGTFLGEFAEEQRLVRPTEIKVGDVFRVGLTRMCIEGETSAAAAYGMMMASRENPV